MRIIVCIKQVPDTTEVKTDPKTGALKREGVAATINPFDMFALEEAIRLKEEVGGTVTALTMGPPMAEHSLRYALALGCDRAVLLSDRAFAGADTLATSYSLAKAIGKIGGYDVIFAGTKTTDGDTGQVGAGIAESLNLPVVYYVTKISKISKRSLTVERLLEDRVQVLSVALPCVLSVVKGINRPRMPTLKEKLEAQGKPLEVLGADHIGADRDRIGLNGSPTKVVKVFTPEKRKRGTVIKCGASEAAAQLLDYLQKQKLLGDPR